MRSLDNEAIGDFSDSFSILTSCPVAGTSCDDGNPDTINDEEDGNCNCAGEEEEETCPAVGTSCDDENPNTLNDVEDGNCNCAGEDAFITVSSPMAAAEIEQGGIHTVLWTSNQPGNVRVVLWKDANFIKEIESPVALSLIHI